MPLSATCHCGATRIEVARAPESATECTCTFCTKSGGLWAYYTPDEVRIVTEEAAGIYSATGFNQHHFCARCGCPTFADTPDWSLEDKTAPLGRRIGLNARLFDDFDLSRLPIAHIDGRNLW